MIANEDLEDVSQNLLIVNSDIPHWRRALRACQDVSNFTVTILVSPGIDPG
jgi:hypothetical protein